MNSYQKVYQEKRALLIENRAREESAFDAWLSKLRAVDTSVLNNIVIPDDMSYRSMLPELYKDNPNIDIYKKQVAELENFVTRVNNAVEKINAEALECLRKYNALS